MLHKLGVVVSALLVASVLVGCQQGTSMGGVAGFPSGHDLNPDHVKAVPDFVVERK